mmetsp:Transcript_98395/g.275549  ORF Transcript_98395/g.275549 Transcript_98395/m.275549 type:complete len:212 (+) Transcript_98395:142-777(+)
MSSSTLAATSVSPAEAHAEMSAVYATTFICTPCANISFCSASARVESPTEAKPFSSVAYVMVSHRNFDFQCSKSEDASSTCRPSTSASIMQVSVITPGEMPRRIMSCHKCPARSVAPKMVHALMRRPYVRAEGRQPNLSASNAEANFSKRPWSRQWMQQSSTVSKTTASSKTLTSGLSKTANPTAARSASSVRRLAWIRMDTTKALMGMPK